MPENSTTRIAVYCIVFMTTSCIAQTTPQAATPPAPPATRHTGCVQRSAIDKDVIVLSTETVCAKLTGNFSADKLVGHEVDLKGELTPGTLSDPAVIHVESVSSVQKSCSEVCSLLPPGKRGLKKGQYPGKEGGTPGAAPTKPPQ
jgi:hypothetical protein